MKKLIIVSLFSILEINITFSQSKVEGNAPSLELPGDVVTEVKTQNAGSSTYQVFQNNTSAQRTAGLVGSLPGNSGVSASGSATYNIPIWVSPGTNGMQPSLNISYNSSKGNGMMGLGWGIEGLSAITRAPKDYQHFQINNNGVNINDNDMFMLDGNLLFVSNGGIYGADGTEYHTENETFSKIISKHQQGNGPLYFEVYTKDGKVLEYGNTADSRVEYPTNSSNTAIYWQLNKVIDANSNFMTYEYLEVAGESEIHFINYSGNPVTNFVPYNHIEFTYLNNRYDANTGYVGGIGIPSTKILDKIKLSDENGLIYRKYEFTYNQDFNNNRLTEIKYFGDGGAALNATLITWGAPTIDFNQISLNVNPGSVYFSFPGDFNGDGIEDIISVEDGHYIYSTDHFNCHFFNRQAQKTSISVIYNYGGFYPEGSTVADIDGDGIDEFVANFRNGATTHVRFFKYNGATFTEISTAVITLTNASTYTLNTGDFDGNGITDILAKTFNSLGGPPHDYWFYYSYNTSSNQFSLVSTGTFWGLGYAGTKFYSIEFNGDGKTDILVSSEYNNNTYCDVVNFTPNGISFLYSTLAASFDWKAIYPGDFNGDGKTDLLTWDNTTHKMNVSYSDGLTFIPEQEFYSSPVISNHNPISYSDADENFFVSDFNGDGKDDVIFASWIPGWTNCSNRASTLAVYLSRGNNNFDLELHAGYSDCINYGAISTGDFNGDGKSDLFNQHYTDDCSGGTWFGVWDVLTFHADEQQNLVQTILNGFDVTSHFYYQPLTELASPVYTMGYYIKGTGAQFPVYDYQGPFYVVNRTNKTDPNGNMLNDMEYWYWGAKVHRQGRGFLTFAKTDAIERATLFHHVVTSDYDLNYFYPTITETRQERHWGANIDQHYKTTLVNDKLNLGNNTFFPYIISSETVNYLTHVTVNHDFDYLFYNDGNLYTDHLTTSNLNSSNNFDKLTTNTYDKFPSTIHCNNKLTNSVTVTTYPGGQSTYTVEKNYDYDAITGNLTLDKTSVGNGASFVETQYYYITNGCGTVDHKIVNGSQNSYSGWASPVSAPDPITTTYFYNTKHRFVSSSKNTLGQIIDFTFDGTGNILFVNDIDGLTDGFRYDAFGREESRIPKRHNLPGSTLGEIKTNYYWATGGGGNEPAGCSYYVITGPDQSSSLDRPPIIKYYDAFERLLRTETKKLTDAVNDATIFADIEYETNTGRLHAKYKPYWVGSPKIERTEYVYSAIDGRVTSTKEFNAVNMNALITDYTYSLTDNKVTVTLPSTQTEVKTFDDFENLIESTENGETQNYTYFSNGKIASIQGPISFVEMTYDDFGNQVTLNDPDAGLINYKYDSFGRLAEQTDAKGDVFILEYNSMGMMTRKTENTTKVFNYKYFGNGNNAVNKLQNIKDVTGNILESYTYTSGMPDLESWIVKDNSGLAFTTGYSYYLDGLLETTTY